MKKILAYSFAAILLGAVTTLAPFALFVSETDTGEMDPSQFTRAMSSETEQAYGITSATYPPDFLFIAFMLTLSLVIALGVMGYFKRKTIL